MLWYTILMNIELDIFENRFSKFGSNKNFQEILS